MSRVQSTFEIIIERDSTVRMIYTEAVEPLALGHATIQRASNVEPDQNGLWWADLSPVNGPKMGPYLRRSDAVRCEVNWLEASWLNPEVAERD